MGYDRHECYSIAEGELKMSGRYPAIVYTEEGMREGMQIEAFFPKPSAIYQ